MTTTVNNNNNNNNDNNNNTYKNKNNILLECKKEKYCCPQDSLYLSSGCTDFQQKMQSSLDFGCEILISSQNCGLHILTFVSP